MEKNISLPICGLHRVSALNENNFTFIVGNNSYSVNRTLAVLISPLVSKLIKIDPLMDTFCIDVNDDTKQFEIILTLMEGSFVPLKNKNDLCYIYKIAEKLENKELLEKLIHITVDSSELTMENVFERLEQKLSLQIGGNKEIEFLSGHMYEKIPRNKFFDLDSVTLSEIFSNENLKIENEASLFEIVKDIIEINGNEYKVLLSTVMVEHLDREQQTEFVELCNKCDLDQNTWQTIWQRLIISITAQKPTNNCRSTFISNRYIGKTLESIDFQYSDNKHFNGILHELTRVGGGNVHQNGLVEITVSSYHSSSPSQIADFGWNSSFWSANNPNSWIKFDFLKKSVKLSAYTLKTTSGGGQGYYHMKSWVVEGSNDGISWIELDRKVDNEELNAAASVKTFQCQHQQLEQQQPQSQADEYRFIRVRQIGPNHGNSDYLVITNVEFFGVLSKEIEEVTF